MEEEIKKSSMPVTQNDLEVVSKVFKPRGKAKESRTEAALKVLGEAQEKAGEKKEVVVGQKKEEQSQESVNELETPFFKIKGQAQAQSQEGQSKVDFTVWDNLSAYAKENGFELKTPNDLETVFKAVNDERKKNKDFEPQISEWKNKATSFEKLMVNMPVEIANPFLAWAEGKDYKAEIRKLTETPFDLTVSADRHNKLELVNYFGKEKFTEEEWEGLNPRVKTSLEDSATQMYGVKQQEVLQVRTKANNERLEKQDKFVKSVDVAITNLEKDYPDMKKSELQEVRRQMLGGINETLYNNDGTYKETAGKQISMAIFGEKTLGKMKTALESKMNAEISKIKSGEREQILIAGQEGVNLGRGAGDVAKNKLVEDVRKNLKSVLNRVGK